MTADTLTVLLYYSDPWWIWWLPVLLAWVPLFFSTISGMNNSNFNPFFFFFNIWYLPLWRVYVYSLLFSGSLYINWIIFWFFIYFDYYFGYISSKWILCSYDPSSGAGPFETALQDVVGAIFFVYFAKWVLSFKMMGCHS